MNYTPHQHKCYTLKVMTLRTQATEARYQADKAAGRTRALADEPSIQEWTYWRLIDNRYPHDRWYTRHHLLIPKRVFPTIKEATASELMELFSILFTDLDNNYDSVKINYLRQQTKPEHLHFHLADYKTDPEPNTDLINDLRAVLDLHTGFSSTVPVEQSESIKHPVNTTQKVCKGCQEIKDLDEFHKASNTKDGRQSRCKECLKIYQRERYYKQDGRDVPATSKDPTVAEKPKPLPPRNAHEAEMQDWQAYGERTSSASQKSWGERAKESQEKLNKRAVVLPGR